MPGKWSVIVPTNRPERLEVFLQAWQPLFDKHDVSLRVIRDEPETWKHLPDFIPTRTDMIRSWEIYQAWVEGSEYTLSLDDDVLPEGDIIAEYEKAFEKDAPLSDYLSVGALTTSGLEMRGFPYRDRRPREVAVQYGGWHGVLDYDAATQLAVPQRSHRFHEVVMPVPNGVAATCCVMNVAWRTKYAPIMWQLPMLEGRYNRTGDIWSGLFQKKTLDQLGAVMLINGKASVRHERASDPLVSLGKEQPGLIHNENLWGALHADGGDMLDTYRSVTDSACLFFATEDPEYAAHFAYCRDKWLALFA